jgi:transposase
MARYKETEKTQGYFIPVVLSEQIIEGTYEYTLRHLIDNKLDLRIFDKKYSNDETGASAINPKILLKVILYCYNQGILSSRKIAAMCETHMTTRALAEDTQPHCTTISNFVSGMGEEIEKVFTEVLLVCDELKLIGGKMFAQDGCKLPSNASKEWSGTKEELQGKYDNIQKISREIIEKHKSNDRIGRDERERDEKKLERLDRKAEKIRGFLKTHEDRTGAGGETVKSNITDNESGKIKGAHGTIQGYNGLAVADGKNQVILAAKAYGTVAEGQFFSEMLEETEKNLRVVSGKKKPLEGTVMLADTAHFSEDNLQAAKKKKVIAVIPDQQYRNRDEVLKDGERREGKERFDARYFKHVKKGNYYLCPNGKKLAFRCKTTLIRREGNKYESKESDCAGCPYADRCVHSKKSKKKYRTLFIPILKYKENLSQEMRENIDKPKDRKLYANRMKIIEPVFGNITYNKGMSRFMLRGQGKVTVQWQLYCIVHNIGKCNMAERGRKRGKGAI